MSKINWKISKADLDLIIQIVNRAFALHPHEQPGDRMELEMDITAIHMNDCPLRLEDWLKADQFNFLHDLIGIRRHIDRKTATLKNHFSPRFSAGVEYV